MVHTILLTAVAVWFKPWVVSPWFVFYILSFDWFLPEPGFDTLRNSDVCDPGYGIIFEIRSLPDRP